MCQDLDIVGDIFSRRQDRIKEKDSQCPPPVTTPAENNPDAWEQLEQAGSPQLSAHSTQINNTPALPLWIRRQEKGSGGLPLYNMQGLFSST